MLPILREGHGHKPLRCEGVGGIWEEFSSFTAPPPTEAALLIERLSGQSKKMADGAGLVRDFQPPFGAVAQPCDSVTDHIRAYRCGLVPSRLIIQQIDGHLA